MLPEKGGSADAGDGALPLSQKGADAKRIAHLLPASESPVYACLPKVLAPVIYLTIGVKSRIILNRFNTC